MHTNAGCTGHPVLLGCSSGKVAVSAGNPVRRAAAAQFSLAISDLIWAFLIGMGNVTAVVIGNEFGAERVEHAYEVTEKLIVMEFTASLFLAATYASMGYCISGIFGLTDSTRQFAIYCIYVNAAFIPVRLLCFVYIVGILRSGGDTEFCMFYDISMVWFVDIPLSFLAVLVFKMPIYWAMAPIMTEEVLKVILAHRRFRTRKWINVPVG
jgi:Na+-driven multidrug efflux pump